jgi:phosphotriesterase-related protein
MDDLAISGGGKHASVETVLGPVPCSDLGPTDSHEHLFLRSPALVGDEFDDLDRMEEELGYVAKSGIASVVELTPVGLHRDARKLIEVSQRSGVRVVAATGFHRDAHYPAGHWVYREPDKTLLEVLLTDLNDGMDLRDWAGPSPEIGTARAGILKLGGSYQVISASERRRAEVGAEAARISGTPVAVHCEVGTTGEEFLDILEAGGVSPDRVALAHMDRNPDVELHATIADKGAYLLYDTVGRVKYRPDSVLLDLIEQLVSLGYSDRILLGTDVGRRNMLRSYGGGPGMDVLGRVFVPRLTARLGQEVVTKVLCTNPAGFLASRPGPVPNG